MISNRKMLREHRGELILICITISFFAARLYLATFSSYSFFQGWNEGHYSLFAKGYFEHSLLIQERGGSINWAVPPLYSWIIFASFKLFGISDISARLTSVLATVFAIPFIYLLAKELYSRNVAILSSLIFLFIPWVVHLSGRVQTDMVMTALMTASIACFVHAHNHKRSFIPFGVFFGLALFTKQPSILILAIIAVWLILVGGRNEKFTIIKKCIFPVLIGVIPILTYALYHVGNGNASGVLHLVYGEATHRMVPFENLKNTAGGILVGISPLVLLFAFYEMYKRMDKKNILFIWIAVYGLFVLARTPPSHEYYILPLAVPFGILASKCIFSFRDSKAAEQVSRKRLEVLVAILVILSTIPVSYVFSSYTGDLGYTCTKDVADYLDRYMAENPDETYLMVLHGRYAPQLEWYMNLMEKQIGSGVGNDLAAVSVEKVKNIAENSNATRIFLVIDGRGGLDDRLESAGYERVYASYYLTKLPSIFSKIYTSEESKSKDFEQHLSIYELK